MFLREAAPECAAGAVDTHAPHAGVGPCKVDQLEDARGGAVGRRQGAELHDPSVPDLEDLPRLDLTHQVGFEDLQRARLAHHDVAVVLFSQNERPKAARVARRIDRVVDRQDDGECSFQMGQRVVDLGIDRVVPRLGDEVYERLGVGGRAEDCAFVDEPRTQLEMVGEVAVVRERDVPPGVAGRDGLNVLQAAAAGRRIAHVSDGCPTPKLSDRPGIEDVSDQPLTLEMVGPVLVVGDDPRGFLSPVLKRVEAQKRELRSVVEPADADDAALFPEPVVETECVPLRACRRDHIQGPGVSGHITLPRTSERP